MVDVINLIITIIYHLSIRIYTNFVCRNIYQLHSGIVLIKRIALFTNVPCKTASFKTFAQKPFYLVLTDRKCHNRESALSYITGPEWPSHFLRINQPKPIDFQNGCT